MRIVVDANIVIMALLGSRATYVILTSGNHLFYVPKKIIQEIKKHSLLVCEKLNISSEEFRDNLQAVLLFVRSITREECEPWLEKAKQALDARDSSDAEYLACALAVQADFIWTQDKDFSAQHLVLVKNTQQFLESQK